MSETVAQELRRLVTEAEAGEVSHRLESWNMIAACVMERLPEIEAMDSAETGIVAAMNRISQLEAENSAGRNALKNYMGAVEMMNAAMKDGGNVHGAISNLIGATDNARFWLGTQPEQNT